jgi:N-dimethylarginine dimethylaminohydrolase
MDVAWLDKYLENWRGYSQSVCFDLNVLVIDSSNIIFARHIPKLFAKLKALRIDCHVVPQRHYLFWEGGIHCSTLDIARKGHKRKII